MRCVGKSTQVPGAQLAIFENSDKGSHFMFIENPAKFNGLVAAFMAERWCAAWLSEAICARPKGADAQPPEGRPCSRN